MPARDRHISRDRRTVETFDSPMRRGPLTTRRPLVGHGRLACADGGLGADGSLGGNQRVVIRASNVTEASCLRRAAKPWRSIRCKHVSERSGRLCLTLSLSRRRQDASVTLLAQTVAPSSPDTSVPQHSQYSQYSQQSSYRHRSIAGNTENTGNTGSAGNPETPLFPCEGARLLFRDTRIVVTLGRNLCLRRRIVVTLGRNLCPRRRIVVTLRRNLCPRRRIVVPLSRNLCPRRRIVATLSRNLCLR